MIQSLELPAKLEPLFQPKRYKVVYGGRGSAKSHSIARILLTKGAESKRRILCAREFQNSIADSVHKLLSDIISEMHLDSFYKVQNNTITGANGTEFIFFGLRHNIQSIKSLEGITDAWVEEAQVVSKNSWDILIPTIREEDSEIWITFNPELETDETYQRFVVKPPTDSIVIEMNYKDNPWFPTVLEQERLDLKARDEAAYLNVWEGQCKQAVEGAIYAKQLQEAETTKRITSVPYNPAALVVTSWDLGYSDTTAIWFAQKVGFEYHIIDYYENNLQDIAHYVKILQSKTYVYDCDYLPHDARAKQLGTGLSIEEQLRSLGRKVRVVPMLSIVDGIAAVRSIFPQCYFDREKCADGLNAIRHYQYGINQQTGQVTKEPLHNWASHAADSFRYLSVASKGIIEQKKERKEQVIIRRGYGRI
jgi:phage terminase large subunit